MTEDRTPDERLPQPLGVAPETIESCGRRLALHVAGPSGAGPGTPTAPPLLLIHSVNAAASVIEMRALFLRQSQRRTVVAIDLPGFGASSRAPGPSTSPGAAERYTPALMVHAIHDALDWTRRHVSPAPADVAALSLGCEFAALAALAEPASMRSLVLISPTGMERKRIGESYESGRTRERRVLSTLLQLPGLGRALYAALTSGPSMRWFLARSWGTRHVDEALFTHGRANARVPGAHHAPLDFLSGALFTRGIVACYRRLALPVLVAHGRRGAFTDFEAYGHVATHSPGHWQRRVFHTGAMPHLEWAAEFDAAYQSWLATHVLPAAVNTSARFGLREAPGNGFAARGAPGPQSMTRGSPDPTRAPLAGAG